MAEKKELSDPARFSYPAVHYVKHEGVCHVWVTTSGPPGPKHRIQEHMGQETRQES